MFSALNSPNPPSLSPPGSPSALDLLFPDSGGQVSAPPPAPRLPNASHCAINDVPTLPKSVSSLEEHPFFSSQMDPLDSLLHPPPVLPKPEESNTLVRDFPDATLGDTPDLNQAHQCNSLQPNRFNPQPDALGPSQPDAFNSSQWDPFDLFQTYQFDSSPPDFPEPFKPVDFDTSQPTLPNSPQPDQLSSSKENQLPSSHPDKINPLNPEIIDLLEAALATSTQPDQLHSSGENQINSLQHDQCTPPQPDPLIPGQQKFVNPTPYNNPGPNQLASNDGDLIDIIFPRAENLFPRQVTEKLGLDHTNVNPPRDLDHQDIPVPGTLPNDQFYNPNSFDPLSSANPHPDPKFISDLIFSNPTPPISTNFGVQSAGISPPLPQGSATMHFTPEMAIQSLSQDSVPVANIDSRQKRQRIRQPPSQSSHRPNKRRKKASLTCPTCSRSFANITNLKRHQQCVHGPAATFRCIECNAPFSSKKSLAIHRHEAHNVTPITHLRRGIHVTPSCFSGAEPAETANEFSPGSINRSVSVSSNPMHGRQAKKASRKASNENRSASSPNGILSSNQSDDRSQRSTMSDVSKDAMSTSTSSDRRSRRLAGQEPESTSVMEVPKRVYKCRYCPHTSPYLSNMKRHENIVHKRIKAFNCNVCGRSFGTRHNLDLHRCQGRPE